MKKPANGFDRADSRRRSAGFVTGLNATTWLRSKPIGNRRSVIAAQRVSVFLNPPCGFGIILPLRSSLRETREVQNESVLLRSVALAGKSRALTGTTRSLWTALITACLVCSCLFALQASAPGGAATNAGDAPAAKSGKAVAWSEIGAKAGADYKGERLAVTATESGARLRCVFQRLDGEANAEGLWLTSTVTNAASDRFGVKAMEVGRRGAYSPLSSEECEWNLQLAGEGSVSVDGQTVRFSRAGLTEEYSVSIDGVRQDLIVGQAPPCQGAGELVVRLGVSGAQVEAAAYGARLVLENSGREIAYSRLRVTDATGKALAARIEVCPAAEDAGSFGWSSSSEAAPEDVAWASCPSPHGQDARATKVELAVVVEDADAEYPVRIDPTFSDANWVSMGGIRGANGEVYAAVADGSGNLYIGGLFSIVGACFANNIAQWNGSSWSGLGSGMNYEVHALAVSGRTLYAGGYFTTAGGVSANYIAQWNGSSWSALGSGIGGVEAEYPPRVCAGGVGQHVVCRRRFHDGGRGVGQCDRAVEREQLVGAGFGDEREPVCAGSVCAGGVGRHAVCGRLFHDGGRGAGR